jgi:hypothetical protein
VGVGRSKFEGSGGIGGVGPSRVGLLGALWGGVGCPPAVAVPGKISIIAGRFWGAGEG